MRCPGQCAVCHAWSKRHVCADCLRQPPPLERTIAALDCAFAWDGLVQHYKFHQAIDLRETPLERLEQALDIAGAEAPDWLLAVPLSQRRQRERGDNRSDQLARGLARRRGLRHDGRLQLRMRDTSQQAQLPLQARVANVKAAFAVEPWRAQVTLLDDVMTSGATLFKLARVRRQAGAARVQARAVARIPDSSTA